MNMIDVMKRLAELDSVNPLVVKEGSVKQMSADLKAMSDADFKAAHKMTKAEARAGLKGSVKEGYGSEQAHSAMSIDPQSVAELAAKLSSGEIDYTEFKSQLDSLENTDYSMRQGEMGNPDRREADAWDKEKHDWNDDEDQYDDDSMYEDEEEWYDKNGNVSPNGSYDAAGHYHAERGMHESFKSSVKEGAVKQMAADLKTMSDADFKAAHKMTKAEARAGLKGSVKESRSIAECGMSPIPTLGGSTSTPANISITAGSGSELSSMLKDIMSLAGLNKVEPSHMGMTPPAIATMSNPEMGSASADGELMRGVMDKLNPEMDSDGIEDEGMMGGLAGGAVGAALGGPMGAISGYATGSKMGDDMSDDEETDEEYDNSPSDPRKVPAFNANKHAYQPNPPGAAKGRGNQNNPRAHTGESMEQKLFADYQSFVSEDKWTAEKPDKKPTAAQQKTSDDMKEKSKGNTAALKKNSDAFAKKKVD